MTDRSIPRGGEIISKEQGRIQIAWQDVLPIWVDLQIILDGLHVADFIEGKSGLIPVSVGEHELYVKRNWIGGSNRIRFSISPNEEKLFRMTLPRPSVTTYFIIGAGGNWVIGLLLFPLLLISTPLWFNRVYWIEEISPHSPPPPGSSPIPIWKCILWPVLLVGFLLAILLFFR
jgi:hypothetical protein